MSLGLRQRYSQLVTRANKAELWFNAAKQEEAEKFIGEFNNILAEIVKTSRELKAAGVEMTKEEILNGFGEG